MIIASKMMDAIHQTIWMLFIKNTDHHTIHFWRIVAQRTRRNHMPKSHWRNSQDPSGGCNRKSWVKIWVPKSWVISICSHENWCILPWRVCGVRNMTGLFFHILGIIIGSDFHTFQRSRYTTNQPGLLPTTQRWKVGWIKMHNHHNHQCSAPVWLSLIYWLEQASYPIRWWPGLVNCPITMENHHFQWVNPL